MTLIYSAHDGGYYWEDRNNGFRVSTRVWKTADAARKALREGKVRWKS